MPHGEQAAGHRKTDSAMDPVWSWMVRKRHSWSPGGPTVVPRWSRFCRRTGDAAAVVRGPILEGMTLWDDVDERVLRWVASRPFSYADLAQQTRPAAPDLPNAQRHGWPLGTDPTTRSTVCVEEPGEASSPPN
jgi:hypothetical protein